MTEAGPTRGSWRTTLALSAALFVLITALSAIRLVHDSEQRLADTLFRVTPPPAQRSKVVLVLIDDESLQQYGRWPWSRVLLAQLTRNLANAGAGVIGLDILLSEPQSPEADTALRDALKETGRAVLADKIGSFPDGPHWIEPLPEISAAAAAVGHVHAPLDADSVCRSFPARELSIDGSRWAFAVEVARHTDPPATSAFLSSYGVPSTDETAPISIAKPILIPIAYRRDHFEELSARTALQGADLARVRGRPVLVGLGTMETSDRLTTPLTTEFLTPGVEVHAQILDSILTGRKLHEASLWLSGVVLLLTCMLVVIVFRRWRGWSAAAALALMGAGIYALAWLAFRSSFLLPTGSMMLAVITGPLLVYTGDLVLVERSLTQQMRGLRSWLALQSKKDLSPMRSDLSWKLGLLQELQTELGSLYELHKTLLESTQDLVAIFDEHGELLLQNHALAQACPTHPPDTTAMLVNQALVREMNWDHPVGEKLIAFNGPQQQELRVVGVLKDFNYESLTHQVRPLLIRLSTGFGNDLVVRYSSPDAKEAVKLVENKWKEYSSSEPFEYNFLDENFNALYKSDVKVGKLLTIFSLLAILIACLGLFGLAAYTAEQRTREIGIRKAMGASSASIVQLLSSEFTRFIIFAFVLAVVPAWYLISKWLENFAFRVNISYMIFILSGLSALVIALLTVSYQSIKAARINPAETLRYE